jgi:hypothetical protein
MGLLLVVSGLLGMAVGLGGYLLRVVRQADGLIPDHDQTHGASLEAQAKSAAP